MIQPTFQAGLSASAQSVIATAIAFYEATFSDPMTANFDFYNMESGLGSSLTYTISMRYPLFHAALAADQSSLTDASALATLPAGAANPVDGGGSVVLKVANARALGLGIGGGSFAFAGSPCPTFTGDSCIGLNLALTNDATLGTPGGYSLITVIEHEMDEALGLGSALGVGFSAGDIPTAEDLFRYASAGVRSFATNASCSSPPSAFLSLDGTTMLDQFNNCDNTGDYGDWITHSPSQVQDAYTNGTGAPALGVASPEILALDAIGYTLAAAVPEPASLAVLGTALLGLGWMRRRSAGTVRTSDLLAEI